MKGSAGLIVKEADGEPRTCEHDGRRDHLDAKWDTGGCARNVRDDEKRVNEQGLELAKGLECQRLGLGSVRLLWRNLGRMRYSLKRGGWRRALLLN